MGSNSSAICTWRKPGAFEVGAVDVAHLVARGRSITSHAPAWLTVPTGAIAAQMISRVLPWVSFACFVKMSKYSDTGVS